MHITRGSVVDSDPNWARVPVLRNFEELAKKSGLTGKNLPF